MIQKKYSLVFFALLGISTPTFANQIGIGLPYLSGELPKRLQNTKPIRFPREFALLTKDILEQEFLVTIQILDTSWEPSDMGGREERTSLPKSCPHPGIHYFLQDSYQFSQGGAPILVSILYQCKTGWKSEKESILTGYAVQALQNHYKALLKFLPRKEKESYKQLKPRNWGVNVFLDANGSMAYEKEALEKWFSSPRGESDWLQVTYIANNKEYKILPKSYTQIEIPFLGSNEPAEVLGSLSRYTSTTIPQLEKVLQVIYISPNHMVHYPQITNALNRGRLLEKETILVVPPHSNLKELKDYERIANATGAQILYPEVKQMVGLANGSRGNLVLGRGYLRFQQEGVQEYKIPLENRISPFSMADVLEKARNEKIIQKEPFETDTVVKIQKAIEKYRNPAGFSGRKYLVQSKDGASWIYTNETTKLQIGGNYILETVFYLDNTQVAGMVNDPYRTRFLAQSTEYPLLLEYNFNEIPEILRKYKLSELRGFIPVRILEEN